MFCFLGLKRIRTKTSGCDTLDKDGLNAVVVQKKSTKSPLSSSKQNDNQHDHATMSLVFDEYGRPVSQLATG